MRLRREGHHRRRAGGDPAQRSCRLAGLLPRVRRTSVRDSSQTDGQLSHQAEAAAGVAGAASRCRRGGGRRPVARPAIAQPLGPPVLSRRQFGRRSLGATGRASAPRGLRQGKANVRKDTERSVAAERSRHSRRSLPTLLHCRAATRPPLPLLIVKARRRSRRLRRETRRGPSCFVRMQKPAMAWRRAGGGSKRERGRRSIRDAEDANE
jgi:hypothetical protein